MRTGRYRYVEWKDNRGDIVARELYDHQTDPQENEDIADRPEGKAVLEELARQLQATRKGARP
jgi:hypothetical protein